MRAVEWTWAHMGAVDVGVGGDGLWARWERRSIVAPKWETYKDCSLVGKSPSFSTQPLPPTPTNHTNPNMSFDDSSSCMDNILGMLHGESLLLTTRLRPALPLLVLRVVRLPDLLELPAFLANQLPPPSPSTSTVTSFAGGIVTSPILFSLKLVDGLRARPSVMTDSRTSI